MKIAAIRGFRDILPEKALMASIDRSDACIFGVWFSEIVVPIENDLFARAIGETTDIVEKEMYTFTDRDDASLTLRPEGNASVLRAYIEHSLSQKEPVSKLFYIGPMFRRERPQKGRYRQFHQIGAEILGRDDPLIDAELLLMLHDFFTALRLDVVIDINSLGCPVCRPRYREALRTFGQQTQNYVKIAIPDSSQSAPLLDCKKDGCRQATRRGPALPTFAGPSWPFLVCSIFATRASRCPGESTSRARSRLLLPYVI
jgi:histidyl-tRNA synthetase